MRILKYFFVIVISIATLTSCTDTSEEQIKTQIELTSDTGGQDDDYIDPENEND
ncbi:protein of unknown function [Tenacibaculum sp. 190524A02b]|uniref:hypothetical protein n=1 Tax=Tenacibaculum vairaonense TaxID=3137860 RepID=UPI0032B10BAA